MTPDSPSPFVIEAEKLVKRFGALTAVNGVDFSVPKGQFFGLLGPNGAGKTTIIRMLTGFSPLTEGSMRVFGLDIGRDWREIRMRIGVCHQDNTLDPDLTVFENLEIFAGYFAIPRKVARERAAEMLEFFALEKKANAKVMELSGGMARRLMLARALINDPELVILDEPTTGLDPQSRHLLWDRLEKLGERGLTVLLTTHYMDEAQRLCDRLLIVDHGKELVEGSPRALITEHVGESVIEIGAPTDELRDFLAEERIQYEDLGGRVILYDGGDSELEWVVRERFCARECTFRSAGLEDVFLRLTGRELRE